MATTTCSDASQSKAEGVPEVAAHARSCQNRFHALWENVRDGLAILDPDLTIIMANRALQGLFPNVSLVGQKCFNAFRCRAVPCLTAAALQGQSPGRDVHESSTLMRPCQSSRELQWTLSPVFSSSSRLEEGAEEFHLVLLDIRLPRMDGMEVLVHIKDRVPAMPVIMVTGYGDIQTAVESMKRGAFNYITKPFKFQELLALARQAIECGRNASHACSPSRAGGHPRAKEPKEQFILCPSEGMQQVYALVERVCATDKTIEVPEISGNREAAPPGRDQGNTHRHTGGPGDEHGPPRCGSKGPPAERLVLPDGPHQHPNSSSQEAARGH
ncbi:hypothetical protein DSTSK_25130 [Desulforhabdus sp. TSK]|nr:response regulator [Desulforhabdus sp. TSK]GKT09208.1 hypothetical protein DSTSK_25130 [Desulforhabdus sp. TSK]